MIAVAVLALLAPPPPEAAVRQLGAPTCAAREAAHARLALACKDDRRYREAAIAGKRDRDPEVRWRCNRILPCPTCRGDGGVWVGDVTDPQRFDECPYCVGGAKP